MKGLQRGHSISTAEREDRGLEMPNAGLEVELARVGSGLSRRLFGNRFLGCLGRCFLVVTHEPILYQLSGTTLVRWGDRRELNPHL